MQELRIGSPNTVVTKAGLKARPMTVQNLLHSIGVVTKHPKAVR